MGGALCSIAAATGHQHHRVIEWCGQSMTLGLALTSRVIADRSL